MSGRLAAVRRAPFTPAALALAVFALVGVAAVDDYGVAVDEHNQRHIGQTVINSVLPGAADLPADQAIYGLPHGPFLHPHDRYYGVVFEAPLLLAERLLGLADTRAVYLMRHLLTHLFFLTGGLFCYLLAYRLFANRYLALFALLLFLLHPRLYAHSFYNTKDIPFLAMFMIALYLLERAFRRGTTAAFAACGVGVGALINLRVMGIMLLAAPLGLRALDLLQARAPAERRRVLAAAGAFALAAAGTLYALSPYLWRDPFAIVDAIATLARHPSRVATLFQGAEVRWPSIPPHYLPAWMAITTPPATLLLCLIGIAAAVRDGIAHPRSVAANTGARFAWLLVACLALPVAAVVALRSNLYDGWRHMYFLYAPLCLLAVYGLRALLARARRPVRSILLCALAAAMAGMAVDAVRLHPHQHGYFNFLVDRRTPEYLRSQYQMPIILDDTEYREALEYLLARFPGATLHVDSDNHRQGRLWRGRVILPAEARRRIVIAGEAGLSPQFFISRKKPPDDRLGPILYTRRIYHNTLLTVTAVDLSLLDRETAAGHRAAADATYRAAVAGEPLLRSEFDLYLDGTTLTYVKEACPRDTVHPSLLQVVPAAVDDLPVIDRAAGRQPLNFRFARFGVRFDGRCLMRRRLPDYPIRALEVGRRLPEAPNLWLLQAVIDLPPPPRWAGA